MTLIEQMEREALRHERAATVLRQAIATLRGEGQTRPKLDDLRGLGIVDGTERLLSEAGKPLSTNEIAAALLRRGVETSSKKWIPTVYATLSNSPRLRRVGSGRKGSWMLAQQTDAAEGGR